MAILKSSQPKTLPANFDFGSGNSGNLPKTLPANFDFTQGQTPAQKPTPQKGGFFSNIGKTISNLRIPGNNPASVFGNMAIDAAKNIGSSVYNLPGEINKAASETGPSVSKNPILRGPENTLGVAGAIANTIISPFTGLGKAVTDNISKSVHDSIYSNPHLADHPVVKSISDFVKGNQDKIGSLVKSNPETARNLSNAISVVMATLSAPEMIKAGQEAINTVSPSVTGEVSLNPSSLEHTKIDLIEGVKDNPALIDKINSIQIPEGIKNGDELGQFYRDQLSEKNLGDIILSPKQSEALNTGINANIGEYNRIAQYSNDPTYSNYFKKSGGVFGKIKDVATALKPERTQESILSTPYNPKDLSKLSDSERKLYFSNQTKTIRSQTESQLSDVGSQLDINKSNIESSKGITKQQVSQDLQKEIDITTKTSNDLNVELSKSSNEKVVQLRPKIKQAMADQSKTYRGLVEDAMKGKENIKVNKVELSKYIDENSDNPESAAVVKSKLGIQGTGRGGKTTLGDIYNNLKSLKQEVRKPILKGTQVFNAEDVVTDKAIRTLSQFMQSKGVDFSEANSFWAKYAPIRDQWVTDFKPFNQAGTQTGRGASVLVNAAQGKDFRNVNFIQQTEDLLGEPITSEQKAILQKMDVNEKTTLANKIDAETRSANADLLAKQQLETDKIQAELKAKKITQQQADKLSELESKKFETEKLATRRGLIKKWINRGVKGLIIDKALKQTTGIGL